MTGDKTHWPFGDTSGISHDPSSVKKAWSAARNKVRSDQIALHHQRHDRLIVGGRAHTKKQGLS